MIAHARRRTGRRRLGIGPHDVHQSGARPVAGGVEAGFFGVLVGGGPRRWHEARAVDGLHPGEQSVGHWYAPPVMAGLKREARLRAEDPAIHRLERSFLEGRWTRGSSPRVTIE